MARLALDDATLRRIHRAGYVVIPKTCVAARNLPHALVLSEAIPTVSPTVEALWSGVEEYFGVRKEVLLGPATHLEFAEPRQMAMYLLMTDLGWRQQDAARALNRDDRTTARHARNKIDRLMRDPETGAETRKDIDGLRRLWGAARARLAATGAGAAEVAS